MNKSNSYYIGLDVGGTKIEAILIEESNSPCANSYSIGDRHFKEILRKRILTERDKGYLHVISNISKLVLDTLAEGQKSIDSLCAIGIGLPGSIDPKSLTMINGNSQIFINKDVIKDLKTSLNFNRPIYLDNDANLFALAETYWGAGKQYEKQQNRSPKQQIAIGIILGTGCGGGVLINGNLLVGKNGGAAEIGHSVLVKDGIPCYCGRQGCAEQYLSGTGLERLHKDNFNKVLKGIDIFKGIDSCESCKRTVDEYIQYLSLFITNLTNIFDPDYIVLGGGVSNQDYIYPIINRQNKKDAFITDNEVIVYKNELGDSAGVLGAALLPIIRS